MDYGDRMLQLVSSRAILLSVGVAACSGAQDSSSRPALDDVRSFPTSRQAWLWPFAADSPWNLPVGTGLALDEGECARAVQDRSVDAWVNAATWSHPIFRAGPADPSVDVVLEGVVVATTASPAEARPSEPAWPEGDAHLHLVDAAGTQVTEMWKARAREDGGWDVDSVAVNDLLGPGYGQGGVRVYGGSAIGGLWRAGEAETGAWHALALSLPLTALAPSYVWPATSLDTSTEAEMTGVVPIGQHVALPVDVDLSALRTAEGRSLARTLRDYGAYVVDHASGFALYAEPPAEDEAEPMRDDIDAIRALLRCSTNNTAETPGGPGERVGPLAPGFVD